MSKKYIEPGITKMESFLVPSPEGEVSNEEFAAWRKGSVTEIRVLAAKANADMLPNIRERVLYLQEHAVEVAFPR